MNYLSIDYGTKRLGLALAVNGIISPLQSIANNQDTMGKISDIIDRYSINQIVVGLSQGKMADLTLEFVGQLRSVLKLPIETVEEAVSTIEATDIYRQNKNNRKNYKNQIDSVAAAVILRRVIS